MDIRKHLGGKYLNKDNVTSEGTVVRIDGVSPETVGGEDKLVMYFMDDMKPMVLNSTNANTLAAMFGYDTAAYRGQSVVIYNDQNVLFNNVRGGLRIKAVTPPGAPQVNQNAYNEAQMRKADQPRPGEMPGADADLPF
jgi:hypothetical protein